jgi:hypothetical protein
MCTVHTCTIYGVVKAKPEELDVKVRLGWVFEEMKRMFDGTKPVAKKQLKSATLQNTPGQSAPLHCGGELVKRLEPYWGNEDSMGHYRQRCGEHNHREQSCRKTARRRQVIRY